MMRQKSVKRPEGAQDSIDDDDDNDDDNDDDDDNDNDDDDDGDNLVDDEDYEGRDEEMTIESKINDTAFNDADNDSDAPVAAVLGLKDIIIGAHYTQIRSHPGNMRASELALLNYKEYCGTQSLLVKRAFATNLSNIWLMRDIDF